MAKASMGMSGQLSMVLRDKYGFLKEERDGPNTVTDVGIAEIVKLATSEAADAFSHIALGDDDTAEGVTDTTLLSEITTAGAERDASTVTSEQENTADDTIQLISGWNFTGTLNLKESGVFTASSAGTMLCRKTFTTLVVGSGDSLTVTWKVTLNQA